MKTRIKFHGKLSRGNKKSLIKMIKHGTLEDFFGKLGNGVKIDAQKMKDESRRMWNMN